MEPDSGRRDHRADSFLCAAGFWRQTIGARNYCWRVERLVRWLTCHMQVYHKVHFTNEREGITDEKKNEVGKYLVSCDHAAG